MKKKPRHLMNLISGLTPCGKNGKFAAMYFTDDPKKVTCKACKRTHWLKSDKKKVKS